MSDMPPPAQPGPEQARNPKADAKAAAAYAKASRPWYKKKRWWAVGVIVLIIAISAASGGGDTEDPPTVAEDTTSEDSKEPKGSKESDEPEPEPEPEWKTVSKLSGNTNKAGSDFGLNGCDTRMLYDVQGAESTVVAFYVMDSDTQLMEDGGIPVASPTESGPGETVIRKDEGDYYVEVVAANAEWQVQVQEKC